ncbi:MAG: ABC transporter ATP-binding protein/permease [Deltaproteobacteria bacterium]|jgi:ABC-type multidrug transport system fused ATPase/permease subunit|nr:ABC transporter ATP-binding protein/permease [Deltaproteobacteria bacterium]
MTEEAKRQTRLESAQSKETVKALGSDLKLIVSLWPATKSFRHILLSGMLMIILASIIGIILPFLTKVAIDSYILPLGRMIKVDNPETLLAKGGTGLLKKADFLYSGKEGIYFLEPGSKDKMDGLLEDELLKSGVLDPDNWYLKSRAELSLSPDELTKLVEDSGGKIELFPDYVSIREKDLATLPGAITLVLRHVDIRGLRTLAIFFAVCMLLGYGFDLGQRVLIETSSQRLGHSLRERVLAHLFSLSQTFFDQLEAGRLTSRLTSDINNINNLIKSTASTFFSDLLSIFGVVVIMFALSPKLALITLALTPVIVYSTRKFSHIARVQQRDLRGKVALINQYFSETHSGMGLIQAFNRQEHSKSEFGELNKANYLTGLRQLQAFAIFMPVVDLVSSVALASVLWFGAQMVIENSVSLGVLAAFAVYCNRFFTPIKDLAEKMNNFQSAFASIERLMTLLNVRDSGEYTGEIPPKVPGRNLEFKNVSFRYRADLPLAVKNLNFKLHDGETLALVGETGSGKSTVINLMLRFYDPSEGEIFFDGLPLNKLNLKLHRKRIGLVTQDVYLYSGTVMENLKLGRTNLTDKQVMEATERVGASRFIERLPKGYQELLGAEGRTLSSGERQLLACARALIDAPEFVILDEATAFVDSESEELISNAMNTLFEGRSSVIVAHRLSTIKKANRILVFDRGRIVEEGTHAKLVSQKGLYYHLALLQGLAEGN